MDGVGFLMMLVIGGLAGYIAEKVTGSDHGLFTNIFLGIVGAFALKFVLGLVGIQFQFAGWFFGNLIMGIVGASLLILGWRAIKGRSA
ncbi:MAG TPA: GlsB/YeaQ/YmgE family stress response membrane protein [Thermopetrobacter sp.]|nr:GlsB/YeaQ/YmgE family stress response membrane protein [Thermopetrobacter sp.]